MFERPIKHVLIPQPPTEQEQQAWNLAAANAQQVRLIHDQLTAANARIAELEAELKATQEYADRQRLQRKSVVLVNQEIARQNTELQKRVEELEREAGAMRGLLQAAQVASDRAMRERCGIEATNARLRELLRECREYVPVDLQDFIEQQRGTLLRALSPESES